MWPSLNQDTMASIFRARSQLDEDPYATLLQMPHFMRSSINQVSVALGFLVPYLLLLEIRLGTPPYDISASINHIFRSKCRLTKSAAPLIHVYRTPGQSCARPPLIITTLCCCTLCPSPGMIAVMTLPVLNRTLHVFLSPELGFLGVVTPTFRQTPFIAGRNDRPCIKVAEGRAVVEEKGRCWEDRDCCWH
jgi:hypothetical protein